MERIDADRNEGTARRPRDPAVVVAAGFGVAYAAFLIVGSSMRPPAVLHAIGSELAHAAAYAAPIFILFALLRRAKARVAAAASLWLLGLALEAAQAAIPWRSGSVNDVAHNTLGIVAAAAVYLAIEGGLRLCRRIARGLASRRD